jgi:hypothetical protein
MNPTSVEPWKQPASSEALSLESGSEVTPFQWTCWSLTVLAEQEEGRLDCQGTAAIQRVRSEAWRLRL